MICLGGSAHSAHPADEAHWFSWGSNFEGKATIRINYCCAESRLSYLSGLQDIGHCVRRQIETDQLLPGLQSNSR